MTDYNMSQGLRDGLDMLNIKYDDETIEKFIRTACMLLEANQIHKFTTITDPKDMTIKHFIDSLMASKYIEDGKKVIDLGAGAGFPSLPLKFVNDTLDFTLLDSLGKRVNYLNNVIEFNQLKGIIALHSRCEDIDKFKLRDKFDYAIARGVAPLPTLIEYAMPYLKVGGKLIAYKGEKAREELLASEQAFKKLYCEVELVEEFILDNQYNRALIIIKKTHKTNIVYPRGQNKPRTNPL